MGRLLLFLWLSALAAPAMSNKYGMDELEPGSGSGLGYFVGFLGVVCGVLAWKRYSREMSPSTKTLTLAAAALALFLLGAAIDT